MARIDSLTNFLTDVATAIKEKKGDNTNIKASDFDTEITNLPSGGGSTPNIGFVIDEWTTDGYAKKVTVYGMTTLPAEAFCSYVSTSTYVNLLNKNLASVILPSGMTKIDNKAFYTAKALVNVIMPDSITTIGQSAFHGCLVLAITKLPSSLTTIGAQAFQGDKKLAIKTIPDGVKNLQLNTFYGCTSLTQISMKNVTTVYSGSTNNAFYNCTGLKAVWMGSAVTSSGLARYSYAGCTNITKMYIDLPRATVEAFGGYQYAFMNDTAKTGIIICNDDADFITKEEFDATEF